MTSHLLTADQQAVADAFGGFLFSSEKEFVISGPAGVGKTTLLTYLAEPGQFNRMADILGQPHPRYEFHFSATTNKAAAVLDAGIASHGYNASTVHSLMGLRVSGDPSTGTYKVIRDKSSKIIENAVIFIDECSMVDSHLRRLMDESTYRCKLVYVGDHCQMAPIGESISPVFLDNTVNEINQIVRSQHTPAITALANQLRQSVIDGIFRPIQEVPGVIEYLDPQRAQTQVWDHFVNQRVDNARLLCYRNEQVNAMNAWIRNEKGLPWHFTQGEHLVSNSYIASSDPKTNLRIEQELIVDSVSPGSMIFAGTELELETYTVHTKAGGTYLVARDPARLRWLQQGLSKAKRWQDFFYLKETVADLRPFEAGTVYKGQGSTYRDVFVDLADIGRCNNPAQVARMLYVACSRPTHRIYFIGQLPEKYRG